MDQVAQIREKIDIVALISEFVPLKKAGRNFKANCPFHSEKTPSFMVSPDRQTWHCFGSCNKGGDVYSFLMEYERLEFPEALRILAKRAGIDLVSHHGNSGLSSKKELLYQINTFAKEYYHYVLTKHNAGKRALEYLRDRGVTDKVIETFQLGFAPWGNSLTSYLLNRKNFNKEDLVEAGVAFSVEDEINGVISSKLIDFFRNKLIFPLIDHRDNVVGFSGRVLVGNPVNKYINTRETLIYHKGEHIFGLNITKEAIKREDKVILVEGEFDVLSCFQHGFGNVVAIKGTALTEHHVNLLRRYAEKLTFCFDGDKAGQEAIKRSLLVVQNKGITPTVIQIPDGKDPDEALKNEPGLFKKAVKEDISVYDYLLDMAVNLYDAETAEGKSEIFSSLKPYFKNIPNEIVKEHYYRQLSIKIKTTPESVAKEMDKSEGIEPRKKNIQISTLIKRPQEEIKEEYLLAMILQGKHPKELLEKAVAILSDMLSHDRAPQKVMYFLFKYVESTDVFDGKKFGDSLPQELIATYDRSLLYPLPELSDTQELLEVEKLAIQLRELYVRQKIKQKSAEKKEKELAGNDEEAMQLAQEISNLSILLKR